LPVPIPGLVLRYAYLWHDQYRHGQEEATKDRPCVIVLSVETQNGDLVVTVAPITHSPPRIPAEAVEIPATTRLRLGLDAGQSWIMVTEVNRFRWPGPDLRPVSKHLGSYQFGVLPPGLFRQVRSAIGAMAAKQAGLKITPRSETE
jgi:mRNA-degrading endonuclease toxin of MazEF toxin-antitoxin module